MSDAHRRTSLAKANLLTGLLAHKNAPTTPIPPHLQAKMAAVCLIRFSCRCSMLISPVQLANRTQPALESTTDALARASLHPDNTASPHPSLISPHSFPARGPRLGSLAARRTKPPISLRDIDPNIVPSGGAIGAGLGAGRPSLAHENPRRPNPTSLASPFSNFSKIV